MSSPPSFPRTVGKKVSFGTDKINLDSISARDLLHDICKKYDKGAVVTTNFGPNSSVILHLATSVCPDIPVVWVDTGYLSKETYQHAEELTKLLSLNLKVYQPCMSRTRMESLYGNMWETDEKEFGRLRKVEPMKRALNELGVKATVVGLRRSQLGHSAKALARLSKDGSERYRVLPIFNWSDADMKSYAEKHGLPAHGTSNNPRRDALRYADLGISPDELALEASTDPGTKQTLHRAKTIAGKHTTSTNASAEFPSNSNSELYGSA